MENTKHINSSTGKNKGVLIVLLDACRWDYINPEDSPTIHKLIENSVYVKKLSSSSGFTQRTALFTGALPEKSGFYTMYIRDPKTSPYKPLIPFTWFLRRITRGSILHRITRKFINQIPKLTTDFAPPGYIPSEILPHISVIEDDTPIQEPGTLPLESIFDKMREAKIPFYYHMAPVSGNDEDTFQAVLSKMKEKKDQVYLVQFSDTDGRVHEDGVASATRHRVVKEVDERIRVLKETLEKQFEDPWVVVLGDHGMVDTENYVDIWGPVEKLAAEQKLKHGKDFLMFLDSTLARFWFFTERAEKVLTPFLDELLKTNGVWIDEDYRKSHSIPHNPDWYGQKIWRADVGTGIFPDYFHWENDKYIGMHGYDNKEPSQIGTVVFHNAQLPGKTQIETGSLEQTAASICDLLRIDIPKDATGNSFIPQPYDK